MNIHDSIIMVAPMKDDQDLQTENIDLMIFGNIYKTIPKNQVLKNQTRMNAKF